MYSAFSMDSSYRYGHSLGYTAGSAFVERYRQELEADLGSAYDDVIEVDDIWMLFERPYETGEFLYRGIRPDGASDGLGFTSPEHLPEDFEFEKMINLLTEEGRVREFRNLDDIRSGLRGGWTRSMKEAMQFANYRETEDFAILMAPATLTERYQSGIDGPSSHPIGGSSVYFKEPFPTDELLYIVVEQENTDIARDALGNHQESVIVEEVGLWDRPYRTQVGGMQEQRYREGAIVSTLNRLTHTNVLQHLYNHVVPKPAGDLHPREANLLDTYADAYEEETREEIREMLSAYQKD